MPSYILYNLKNKNIKTNQKYQILSGLVKTSDWTAHGKLRTAVWETHVYHFGHVAGRLTDPVHHIHLFVVSLIDLIVVVRLTDLTVDVEVVICWEAADLKCPSGNMLSKLIHHYHHWQYLDILDIYDILYILDNETKTTTNTTNI